jgi:ATP-dependent metalloprotease FtsH
MGKAIAFGSASAIIVFLLTLGYSVLPLVTLLAIGAGVYLFAQSRGNGFAFGRKKLMQSKESVPTTSFDDIGGHERAKKELKEALDFLIHRDQISQYGIRPIKGILLSGPPGTGKTLMAKAAAHYTDSVFVSASGSEFVEMYVGVGAQRMRELFQDVRTLAKRNQKSSGIIFIDEIDAIGGHREGSQHREYDQTLNQLLTEMDGISTDQDIRILVIAATNRKDMLDSALLRPGRFDRQIEVDLPDKKARLHILQLHTQNKPLADDVSLERLAVETFGFSGAQLESVTNEAAIYAMRENSPVITQRHLSAAIDKVMMGEERERVAIHELGHALISELVRPGSVSQVALSPRGQALGYVRQHPGEDRYLYTRKQIEDQIKICLAGAAAEELIYGNRSTGARNDYQQANQYTRTLIETGLSDLGIIDPEWINKEKMQEESTRILNALQKETYDLLARYRKLFDACLQVLLQEETISGDQFRKMMKEAVPVQAKIG